MPKIYKITLKDHLRLAKVTLVYIIVFILFAIFTLLQRTDNSFFVTKVSLVILLLFILPSIYLHISYYFHHKGWIIREYSDYLEIQTEKNGISLIIIDKNNIIEINIYMAPTTIDYNTSNGLPSEDYNYAKIIIPGKEVIITNLIYPDLKALASKFFNIKLNYHKTIFPDI